MIMMIVLSLTDTPGTMVKSTGHIVNRIDLNSTVSGSFGKFLNLTMLQFFHLQLGDNDTYYSCQRNCEVNQLICAEPSKVEPVHGKSLKILVIDYQQYKVISTVFPKVKGVLGKAKTKHSTFIFSFASSSKRMSKLLQNTEKNHICLYLMLPSSAAGRESHIPVTECKALIYKMFQLENTKVYINKSSFSLIKNRNITYTHTTNV